MIEDKFQSRLGRSKCGLRFRKVSFKATHTLHRTFKSVTRKIPAPEVTLWELRNHIYPSKRPHQKPHVRPAVPVFLHWKDLSSGFLLENIVNDLNGVDDSGAHQVDHTVLVVLGR